MSDLFPELRDARRGTSSSATVPLKLGPPNKALVGGAFTLTKYNQLCDLPATSTAGPRVVAARALLRSGRLELQLEGDAIGTVDVRLEAMDPGDGQADAFRLLLVGPVKTEAVRSLLERIQERLGQAPFRLLWKIFRLDPERQLVTLPPLEGEGFDEEIFRRSLVRSHGSPDAWRLFFAELEQQRNFNHYLEGNVVVIKHEDIECSYATPSLHDGSSSFFCYPLAHRARRKQRGEPQEGGPRRRRKRGEHATRMDDHDVIRGGVGKLEAVLAAVAAAEDKPDLVLIKAACVPKVIGDDMAEAMARFEQQSGIPTAYLDNLADEDASVLSSLLARLRWEPEFLEPHERAGRVNLVGYPDVAGMDRLVGLLAELGVVVNARLVPAVKLDEVRRYTWAELQVLFDSQLYQATFEQLLGDVDIRTLRPSPPFGVAGSRAWIEAVASAVGKEQGLEEAWSRAWEPFARPWAALREIAREQRLGFVVDERAAAGLLEPRLLSGVPVLAMLEEMGFSLEFLCWSGDGEPWQAELPGDRRAFSCPEDLEAALRSSRAAAFYSELTFDRRLSRTGKGRFSVADFELGLEGALATAARLLHICETPFQRRYASFLGQAFPSASHPAAGERRSTRRWGEP